MYRVLWFCVVANKLCNTKDLSRYASMPRLAIGTVYIRPLTGHLYSRCAVLIPGVVRVSPEFHIPHAFLVSKEFMYVFVIVCRKLRISPSSSPGPLHPSNASASGQFNGHSLPQAQWMPMPHHARAHSSSSSLSPTTSTPALAYPRAVHFTSTRKLPTHSGHARSKSNHLRRHSQLSKSELFSHTSSGNSNATAPTAPSPGETRSRTASAHVRAPSTHTPSTAAAMSLFAHRRTHTRDSSHTSASSQSSMSSRASSESTLDEVDSSPRLSSGGDGETSSSTLRSMFEEFKLSPGANSKRYSLTDKHISPASAGSYTIGPSSGARFRRKTSANGTNLTIDTTPTRTSHASPRTSPFPLPRKNKSYSAVQLERELTFDYDPATHSIDLPVTTATTTNSVQTLESNSGNSTPGDGNTLHRKKSRRSPSISLVGSLTGLASLARSQTVKLRKKNTRSPPSLPPFPQNRPMRGTPLSSSAPELDIGNRAPPRSKHGRIVFPEDAVLAKRQHRGSQKKPFASPAKKTLRRAKSESTPGELTVGHITHDTAVIEHWNEKVREKHKVHSLLAPPPSEGDKSRKSPRVAPTKSQSARSSPMTRGYARHNLLASSRPHPQTAGHHSATFPTAQHLDAPSNSLLSHADELSDETPRSSIDSLDITDSAFAIEVGVEDEDATDVASSIRSHPSKSRIGSFESEDAAAFDDHEEKCDEIEGESRVTHRVYRCVCVIWNF